MVNKDYLHFLTMKNINEFNTFAISKRYDVNISRKAIIDKETKAIIPYNIDSKILVYENRQKTWFFDIAEDLKENNEAGFVILMIAVSYLEGNQQYRDGVPTVSSTSSTTIITALERIFPQSDTRTRQMFVEQVRQGFFHDGITRKDSFINASSAEPLKIQEQKLIINPHKFLDAVRSDFETYIQELKNLRNDDSRRKFERFWDLFKGI